MGVWLAIAKPIVVIWAGLNAIDDLSLLFRFARLGSVLVPGLSSLQPHMMCDVCDDVMGDLLKGSDGLEALPCGAACLRIPACVRMCENLKNAATNSSHFPCIAAGYCDAVEEGEADADVECRVGAFFSPVILLLRDHSPSLPFAVWGVLAFVAVGGAGKNPTKPTSSNMFFEFQRPVDFS